MLEISVNQLRCLQLLQWILFTKTMKIKQYNFLLICSGCYFDSVIWQCIISFLYLTSMIVISVFFILFVKSFYIFLHPINKKYYIFLHSINNTTFSYIQSIILHFLTSNHSTFLAVAYHSDEKLKKAITWTHCMMTVLCASPWNMKTKR